MTTTIRIHQTGGPERLAVESSEVGEPGSGEVRLRHTAIGLNYIDVYFRTGLYSGPPTPFTPGMEAAGVIEAVGPDVDEFQPGDRVAYGAGPMGSYCTRRVYPAARLVHVPTDIDDQTAAAVMLKGLTARYLLKETHPVRAGDTILFHAAAGGVGQFATQWARALGATIIGTTGSPAKAELARSLGCHHTILYSEENFVDRVRDITDGQGVLVVYDSVGQATFWRSLDCLQPRGHLVSFGQSSGKVEALDIGVLSAKGSLSLTRPTLFHYVATTAALRTAAEDLFDAIRDGTLEVRIGARYPLTEVQQAHAALEARETTGSTILLPAD